MNIIDALKYVIEYYDTDEFDCADICTKEAIEDLTDAAKYLLVRYGEE